MLGVDQELAIGQSSPTRPSLHKKIPWDLGLVDIKLVPNITYFVDEKIICNGMGLDK